MTPEYFIGGIMPYITAFLLIIGVVYRSIRWTKSPQALGWEIFPVPESAGARIGILAKEVLTQHALWEHNRRMWPSAFILHWGLYLVALWAILALIGIQGAPIVGMIASAGILIGSILTFVVRVSTELRRITAFVEYFNIIFLVVISVLGLTTNFFTVINQEYLLSLLTLSPKTAVFSGNTMWTLFLVQLFLIYMPYTRMAHFFAKYFTWDMVKWEEPGH